MSALDTLLTALAASPEVRPGSGPAMVAARDAEVRAAALNKAADVLQAKGQPTCEPGECCWFDAVAELRRMAGVTRCRRCRGEIGWIDCPTGGWWAHYEHPADGHDAEPGKDSRQAEARESEGGRFGPQVQGRCPACGLAALFLGEGGYVTCGNLACTAPDAATTLLESITPQPELWRLDGGVPKYTAAGLIAAQAHAPQLGPNGCPFCTDSTNPDLRDHVRNVHPDQFCMWAHGPRCAYDGAPAPQPEPTPGDLRLCGRTMPHPNHAYMFDRDVFRCPGVPVPLDAVMAVLAAGQAGKDTPEGESTQPSAAEACGCCRQPFDPTDTRFDGRARQGDTLFCCRCVDRCHESTDFAHECAVCRAPVPGSPPDPERPLTEAEIEEALAEDADGEAWCARCGCTENRPCEGGCSWVPNLRMKDLCSACIRPDGSCATPGCGLGEEELDDSDPAMWGWTLLRVAGSETPARWYCSPWCVNTALEAAAAEVAAADQDLGSIEDVYSASELYEMDRDTEFAMDAADDAANTAAIEAEGGDR